MAGDLQAKNVNIYIDDAPAREAYDRLSKKADEYNKKIEEGTKKAEDLGKKIQKALDAGKSPEKFREQLEKANATLDKNREALSKVVDQQKKLQQQMDSKAGPSLKSQQALVTRLTNEYKNLGSNTEEAAKKLEELGKASAVLNQLKERLNAVTKAQNDTSKSSGFLSSFFGNLAAGAVAKATSLVSGFWEGSVQEALDADQATARFKATLDNLGRSDAFDRITKKADELASKFRYLDNDDITAVFNKLIDYGKLTEKQMNDLLPVIIDFAAKQRIPISEASDVIVKALEGNGKALKEYGIKITENSTQAERLGVVMTTLKDKVDGAGEAFQNSAAGGIAVAQQEFKNLQEDIGTNLLPVINNLLSFLDQAIKGLVIYAQKAKNLFNDFKKGLAFGTTEENQKRQDAIDAGPEEAAKSMMLKIKNLVAQNKVTVQQVIAENQKLLNDPKIDAAQKAIRQKLAELLDMEYGTKTLGNGGTTLDNSAAKAAAKKTSDAAKRIKEDQEKLLEELRKLNAEYSIVNRDEQEKEINQAFEKYETLKKLAHGNTAELKQIEEGYQKALIQIQEKYAIKYLQDFQKAKEEREKKLDELIKSTIAHGQSMVNELDTKFKKAEQDKLNVLQLKIQTSTGKEQLNRQQELLNLQEKQAVEAARGNEEAITLIHKEFQKKREENEKAYYIGLVNEVLSYAQQALSIYTSFDQLKTLKENQQLAKVQKGHDAEKNSYGRMLKNKLISQQEYNKKIADLDADLQKKKDDVAKKQFERQKKIQIAQALMNGAQGVTKAIAEYAWPFSLIPIGFDTAATLAQVAVINKQKYEPASYGTGGFLDGPSHSNGGMPVINPVTGRKEAEVEGGEVILSKKTVRNNPEIVGALLNSSINYGGASITPYFRTRSYQAIDYDGLTKSITKTRYFANGGVMPSGSGSDSNGTVVMGMTPEQELLMKAVLGYLQQPPKAYVVYSDIQAAGDKLNQIQADATFRKSS